MLKVRVETLSLRLVGGCLDRAKGATGDTQLVFSGRLR